MAKPPSKRRGITLGPRAQNAESLDPRSTQTATSLPLPSDQAAAVAEATGGEPTATQETMPEPFAKRHQLDTNQDLVWRRQIEQLQSQMQQLEQQRDQIAQQARQLRALQQTGHGSRRLGVLLALMALAGVAALGFHTWPRLQDVAGDLNRVSTRVDALAPLLRDMHGEVNVLTSDMGRMGAVMDSLRQDVSGVRSDLGSLRKAKDTLPEHKAPVQATSDARRSAAHTSPSNATTMSNPYRAMRPMMPW